MDARTVLAFGITLLAMLGITIIAVVIVASPDAAVNARAQNVMNAILPLFGTWVGTVLAYYFSRENFESASSNTQQLVRLTLEDRLRTTAVASIMTKNIVSYDENTKVVDVITKLQNGKIKRILVLKPSGALEALLYLDQIAIYITTVPEADRPNKSIGDLLKEKPDIKETPAYVAEGGSLADAKSSMEKIPDCKVVLVTKSGRADEPVLGMLTNTDIAKHSRA